jgi:hypothetical protein
MEKKATRNKHIQQSDQIEKMQTEDKSKRYRARRYLLLPMGNVKKLLNGSNQRVRLITSSLLYTTGQEISFG